MSRTTQTRSISNDTRTGIACSAFNLTRLGRRGLRRRVLVDQVSVNVANARWTAIAGRPDSGAAELLRSLAGIDPVDGGRVFLAGWELSGLNDNQRRRARNLARSQFVGPQPTPVALADAVARALAAEPRLLFLDTIGGAVSQTVLASLRRACTERGVTVVLATAELPVALAADRALVLSSGRIVEDL
ncbi:hypothetical protein CGZ93_02750 [Enemella dayhoffiae]|uniref:Uncharacterized protein n=1 Tax=Enemella dayhoffiae TaxID=2016507 RepID=A0A255HBE5_9ACTN|nr:hypothetical protein [Enemella dayhoffiae]OYO24636.1 hypothetical protein CGZ93_02750 [Enemella dayhoffiae]